MDNKIQLIVQSFGSDKVKLDEPISKHVATGLGGSVKLFFVVIHTQEIIRIFEMVRKLKVPILIFGTGSKMLISDNGFDGVVVKNRTSRIIVVGVKGKVGRAGIGVSEAIVEADSGVTNGKLIEFLKKQGLDELQLDNISGTIGGNIFINRQLQTLCQKIKAIDGDGDLIELEVADLRLQKHIILSVVFKFKTK